MSPGKYFENSTVLSILKYLAKSLAQVRLQLETKSTLVVIVKRKLVHARNLEEPQVYRRIQ